MQKQTPWRLPAALSIVFLTSGALTTRAFAVGYNDNRVEYPGTDGDAELMSPGSKAR